MKFKKLFIVAVAMICMMAFGQSAFGAHGIYDSKETAGMLFPLPFDDRQLYISDSSDADWYVYTNNTSTPKSLYASVTAPNASYSLEGSFKYVSGFESGLFRANGLTFLSFNNIRLLPGESFYLKISASDPTMDLYNLTVIANETI
ncbi:hypothetical protein PA598K_04768 [Paenibacillus sp. 598K]|uniref:hypothetical protein n=1 Tax=Paenibacillus sp. 598K TaxID=1117987 RepID=UPI000FF90D2F|nr:hypothetical protein [Paenibacillus sp. 598K]GBF76309.1 hypothetical protein PA598K_04768 [Paenibacillus sp. 598K]